jgi:hypothetical protein
MKRYVIAYISFFHNELKQRIVRAENEYEAGLIALDFDGTEQEWIAELRKEEGGTLEQLKGLAFDCDSMISVLEL